MKPLLRFMSRTSISLAFCGASFAATELPSDALNAIESVLDGNTRKFCVNVINSPETAQADLYRSGVSIEKQCSCVTSEMRYIQSEDEKVAVFYAFAIVGGKKETQENVQQARITLDVWRNRLEQVDRGCRLKNLVDAARSR